MKNLDDLQKAVNKAGSQSAFAALLGISQGYLSEVLNRKQPITIWFAAVLHRQLGIDPLNLLKWQATEDWKRHLEKRV